MPISFKNILSTALFSLCIIPTQGQSIISLNDAVQTAAENYPSIKAKLAKINSSKQSAEATYIDRLPSLTMSAQQMYGTVNSINGPMYGIAGSASSSGPVLAQQNSNASFGALYLTSVNWDVFTFGKNIQRTKVAQQEINRDTKDFEQELFQHKIRAAAAYLRLIADQQLTASYLENMQRADSLRVFVAARVKTGLLPGVDLSLADAQFSSTRILYTNALNQQMEHKNILAGLMGSSNIEFTLNSSFISKLPEVFSYDSIPAESHPLLQYSKSQIDLGRQQESLLKKQYYPTFSIMGVLQSRGSGFDADYIINQNAFSHNYGDGINPTRTNYLVGAGITWNFTNVFRVSKQIKAQRYNTQSLQESYNETALEINTQIRIAEDRIKAAVSNYNEAPVQVKAASDAYLQQSALYRNGLTSMADVMQAANTLIRAKTDLDVAGNNVWQALLLKAAAIGNYNLFQNEL
ncbi:TolC family protein [Flavobacterium sp. MC2016-06]|uniref:TolC family protein n=1 Tax=Flavobacterium sp. MC2016-06 TaxID=2676308 RepID=UPI0012BA5FEF|nr:TolC family protein [Flavobacterium sp. MC2016-06]MBU3860640.1 TolC family protein [Flavobacterium sp. MC2016-06]